jgi:hypothetical protein
VDHKTRTEKLLHLIQKAQPAAVRAGQEVEMAQTVDPVADHLQALLQRQVAED